MALRNEKIKCQSIDLKNHSITVASYIKLRRQNETGRHVRAALLPATGVGEMGNKRLTSQEKRVFINEDGSSATVLRYEW